MCIIVVSPQYLSRRARTGLNSESQTAHRQQKLGSVDHRQLVEYVHYNEQPALGKPLERPHWCTSWPEVDGSKFEF
jgi:hypothetical protein